MAGEIAGSTGEAVECPECKGKGQKFLHLHYAKGKGQSGWQRKTCWRCEGLKVVAPDVMSCVEAGKVLDARMKELGRRNDLECLAKSHGIDGVELSKALMGRVPVERIQEIGGLIEALGPKLFDRGESNEVR